MQVSAARDALRYHAVGMQAARGQVRAGLPTSGRFGDTMVCGLVTTCTWVQVGTARDALRYHAVVYVVVRGLYRTELPTVGTLRRYLPSSVCTRRLVKYHTCLRGASGVRLLTFGHCWSEQVGGGSGSDLDGLGLSRAHQNIVIRGVRGGALSLGVSVCSCP